jgi:hypothetical protein
MLQISGNNITITRGDSTPSPGLLVPIYSDGDTPYEVQSGDSVAIQVRETPVTGFGSTPSIVFEGDVFINGEHQPVWYISSDDTTIPARSYSWDAQITLANGDVCTYSSGTLTILPENTIVTPQATPQVTTIPGNTIPE